MMFTPTLTVSSKENRVKQTAVHEHMQSNPISWVFHLVAKVTMP